MGPSQIWRTEIKLGFTFGNYSSIYGALIVNPAYELAMGSYPHPQSRGLLETGWVAE
jgi:hypothetical protein